MRNTVFSIVTLFVLFTPEPLRGDFVVPAGLQEGDQFRVMFVTQDTTQAVSQNLSFYDDFVSQQASNGTWTAGLGTSDWRVVGSTLADNANNHTATLPAGGGVPIFNLAGAIIAEDNADLWDLNLTNPINIDQDGNELAVEVWTGTSPAGARRTNRWLGAPSGLTTVGLSNATNAFWTSQSLPAANTEFRHAYAISGVITVTAVPEPGTAWTLALASLLLFSRRRTLLAPAS